MYITNRIFGAYLNCELKSYLQFKGRDGQKSDFEKFNVQQYTDHKCNYFSQIISNYTVKDLSDINEFNRKYLRSGYDYLINISIRNNNLVSTVDVLEKVKCNSVKGGYGYIPILIIPKYKFSKSDKLILSFQFLIMSYLDKNKILPKGKIILGESLKTQSIKLNNLIDKTTQKISDLKEILESEKEPKIFLKSDCEICEFYNYCYNKAKENDELSLIGSMSEKEISDYNRKGIFTVNQLSYTFRPRRRKKKTKNIIIKYYHSLKALAIREKKIYVYKKPELPTNSVKIYLDVEGDPDRNFFYLIGMLIETKESLKQFYYWINNETEIKQQINEFIDRVSKYKRIKIYHYGSYETKFVNSLYQLSGKKYSGTIDRIIKNSTNVLSVVYASIYFPTYTNGLKEIANYLGFSWSEKELTGLQSVLLRKKWEKSKHSELKEKLISYNSEDCYALKSLTDFIFQLNSEKSKDENNFPQANYRESLDEIISLSYGGYMFKKTKFALKEFDYINQCAYFDYQRDKIYIRTDEFLKKNFEKKRRYNKPSHKVNKEIIIRKSKSCPRCKSRNIKLSNSRRFETRIVIDLKIFKGGMKKWITKYKAQGHYCVDCGKSFLPQKYKKTRIKCGHNLISWVVYQNIANKISFEKITKTLEDSFNIKKNRSTIVDLKSIAAKFYERSYRRMFSQIKNWAILHIDETKVSIQGYTCYIWTFTNLNTVLFYFTENRKTDFIPKLIDGFKGVLISDFYKGYDSINCIHQKCLIHLMRDINKALFKDQQNEELKYIAIQFGTLLKTIIDTIDRYGLKKRYLNKHNKDVKRFYKNILNYNFETEPAIKFIKRFIKYQNSLFTFLNYDGVPWNNNNAEHAFKHFATYRKNADGMYTENSIKKFLILLSLYETCKYRNISFYKFLLSKEKQIDKYCEKYTPLGNKRKKFV